MRQKTNPIVVAAVISTLLPFLAGRWAQAACAGGPDVFECLSEADYRAKVAEFGYTAFDEGFEDGTVWGSVRTPSTAPSVTSQGIIWTANHVQNQITTGIGASLTGLYGIFDPDHGYATGSVAECDSIEDPQPLPDYCLTFDGFTGTLEQRTELIYAAGGYVRTTSVGANVAVFLNGVKIGSGRRLLDNSHHFLGVIDTRGFTRFQFKEIDGKVGQSFSIFGDDFTLVLGAAKNTRLMLYLRTILGTLPTNP